MTVKCNALAAVSTEKSEKAEGSYEWPTPWKSLSWTDDPGDQPHNSMDLS